MVEIIKKNWTKDQLLDKIVKAQQRAIAIESLGLTKTKENKEKEKYLKDVETWGNRLKKVIK